MSHQTNELSKKLCDCPCKSECCTCFTHTCDKPDEHYPQSDQAYWEVKNEIVTALSVEIEKLKRPFQPDGKPYTTLQAPYPKDHYNQAIQDVLNLLKGDTDHD